MGKLSWEDQRNSQYKGLAVQMGLGCSKQRKASALGVMSKGQYSRGSRGPDTTGFEAKASSLALIVNAIVEGCEQGNGIDLVSAFTGFPLL